MDGIHQFLLLPDCLEASLGPFNLLFGLMQQYAACSFSAQVVHCYQIKRFRGKVSAHNSPIYTFSDLFFISHTVSSPLPGFQNPL